MNSTDTNNTVLAALGALIALLIVGTALVGLLGTASAFESVGLDVNGTVQTDDGTGVSNATVAFLQNETVVKTVQTNETGHYSTTVENGTYTVEIDKSGYTTSVISNVTVDSEKTVDGTLFPAFIDGIVATESGAIEGATVELVDSNGSVVKTASTDSSGTYSIEPPAVDTYTVRVTADGYTSVEDSLDMTQTTTFDATLATDSDGDGIPDSEDSYPTEAEQSYTVTADDNKTVESVYAEINASEEITVTILHNGTELSNKTVTPSEVPETVAVSVDTDHDTYTVTVHGVSDSDVSATGAFYASDSAGGGAGGSDDGRFVDQIGDNPIVSLIVALVAIGAIAVIREEL